MADKNMTPEEILANADPSAINKAYWHLIGTKKSERKAETSRANGQRGGFRPTTDATREKLRQSTLEYHARRRAEAGLPPLPTPGEREAQRVARETQRAVKAQAAEAARATVETSEKRGRGRPRKVQAATE